MWRKFLKCREVAKKLYRVEIKNGRNIFFWYESWFFLRCLKDFFCDRGYIDMGIFINVMVCECSRYRRRFYKNFIFNRVREVIDRYKVNITEEEDVFLWRNGKGDYKNRFLLKEIW